MATGYMTTTNQAYIIPEKWGQDVLFGIYQKMVMREKLRFMNVELGLDTVHFPTVGKLTAEEITEGTELEGKDLTPGQISLVIDQNWGVPLTISKRVLAQAQRVPEVLNMYKERAIQALKYKIDQDLLGMYSLMSQSVDATAGFTAAKLLEGIEYLDEAGAPEEDRHLVITPQVKRTIMGLTEFKTADVYGGREILLGGRIGTLYGVNIWVTNAVKKTGTTTVTAHNILFQKDYGILGIQKGIDVEVQPMAMKQGTDVVASVLYGYKELRDDHGIVITTTEA